MPRPASFALQPYAGNDSLRLTGNASGALALAIPAQLGRLSILTASGDGAAGFNFTLHFADGSSTVVTGNSSRDWFGGAPVVIGSLGRVGPDGIGGTPHHH